MPTLSPATYLSAWLLRRPQGDCIEEAQCPGAVGWRSSCVPSGARRVLLAHNFGMLLDAKWIGVAGAAAAVLAAYAQYRSSTRKRRVVITGGCGNLGTKLATRLLATGKWEVLLLEHPDFMPRDASRVPRGAIVVAGDLTDGTASWAEALRGADSLVHFSAVNPYHERAFDSGLDPDP